MRLHQARWWVLPIALLLPAACTDKGNETADSGPPANSAPAPTMSAKPAPMPTTSASAKKEEPKKMHKRGFGMAGMLLHAAHDLHDLTEPQKATLDKLSDGLQAAGPQKEIKDLHMAEIAGVKAGKLDTAKLKANFDAIDKAVDARHDKEVEVLGALHAALQPAQRKALVAAVKAKMAEHEKKAEEHAKKDAEDWQKKHLETLTKELDLDAGQQKKVGELLDKGDKPTPAAVATYHEEAKKRWDTLLKEFEGDKFDAKKLELNGPGKKLRERLEKHVQFLEKLLPILKPPQREKLAAVMEKHPAAKGDDGAQHDEEHPYHPIWQDQGPADDDTPPSANPVIK